MDHIDPDSNESLPENIDRWSVFGVPPIIEGEDEEEYYRLRGQIFDVLKPVDIIEQFYARDVLDYQWGIFQCRRDKVYLRKLATPEGLHKVLERLIGFEAANALATAWANRDANTITKVKEILTDADMTMNTVMTQVEVDSVDVLDRIDRRTMIYEARRDAALREIARHRGPFGRLLRNELKQIEDAQIIEDDDS